MKGLIVYITLAAMLCIVPQLGAKTFYMNNGERIEYQRYWEKDGRVYVLINRDILVDFTPEEVNIGKTEKAAGAEKNIRHRKSVKRVQHKAVAGPKGSMDEVDK